jgi:hypothetical protein
MIESQRFSQRSSDFSTDARADVLDFRDTLFRPTMAEVPPILPIEPFQEYNVPVLDQGRNNGCTGFTVATLAHYLLRKRKNAPDLGLVSQNMLYTMARRYDEYPGEDDSRGSSLRGAMKGWHKHGICSYSQWPWDPNDLHGSLTPERAEDAALRPLGLYQRVNHKDIPAMHSALAEVGIIAASALIPFNGWYYGTQKSGVIPTVDKTNPFIGPWGGHAFAIVGYDADGFWLQNSWGSAWGKGGFGRLCYDDWLQYGFDAWVGRLGVPIRMNQTRPIRPLTSASRTFASLRPHLISIDMHGQLQRRGAYGTTSEDVRIILEEDFLSATDTWRRRRLVLIAGGALRRQVDSINRMSRLRPKLLGHEIYPIEFLWETDHYARILELLHRATEGRRHDGYDPKAFGFMIDRRDDALEPLIRRMGGKAEWDRMKLAAGDATMDVDNGGVRETVARLAVLMDEDPKIELHLVAHSSGTFLFAPLVQLITSEKNRRIEGGPMRGQFGLGLPIESVSLLAPASAIESFRDTYMPAIKAGTLRRFALFTLTDEAELQDHCEVYGRSLLYLVSNAMERRPRVPGTNGVPLLGMEAGLLDPENTDVLALFAPEKEERRLVFPPAEWIKGPNTKLPPHGSEAQRHEDFENDAATWRSVVARILNQPFADQLPPMSARESW